MRWLAAFFVVFVGCVYSLPADTGITADLAAETARMVVQMRQQIPPSPAPASDVCSNCNGTGKVRSGDGIQVFTCQACRGTGKALKSVCVEGCKP
jgi:DnaJ-class molecular chaperone